MLTDLHLVSWNRPKMTELVIKTIHHNTRLDDFRLVVWDNGSDRETVGMLKYLEDNAYIDELILAPENMGLEYARQQLLKYHTFSEYFVCIDNDCLPPPAWLQKLTRIMEDYPNYGAVSLRTQVMIGTGNIFENADTNGDELVEFPHPGGSYRIMRTELVKAVGGWDRGAYGRGAEERYIGRKLQDAGFKTAFTTNIQCLHLFGDRQQTTERWGYKQGMNPEETGHSDIDHPALRNGDSFKEVEKYTGTKLAKEYFSDVISSNTQ